MRARELFEALYPDWYAAGTVVDITSDRYDIAEYLEGDEFDYEYRLCMVPASLITDPDFAPIPTSSETGEARAADITNWADGDFKRALLENPPVVLWSGRFHNIDGYHRINLAAQAGLTIIPVIVGMGPPLTESSDGRGRSWINANGEIIPVEGNDKEHDCVTIEHGLHGIEDAEYHGWIRINTSQARGEFNLEWRRGRVSKQAMRAAMQELRRGGYTTVIVDEDCSETDRMYSQRFTDVNAAVRYCTSAAQNKINEAVRFGEFPTRSFKKLWHVGSMKAGDKRQDSYEGAGLSVSVHPAAWRKIARGHVSGDTWEMTKSGNRFLDYHKIGKRRWGVIRQWATENGWAEAKTQYEVSWYDDEMEQRVGFVFDTREEAEAESDPEYNEDIRIKEIPTGITGTQQLATRCRQRGPTSSPQELLASVYAEDVLGLDGVWWQDIFDPSSLSAPRGVIVPSKVSTWTYNKGYDEDEES